VFAQGLDSYKELYSMNDDDFIVHVKAI